MRPRVDKIVIKRGSSYGNGKPYDSDDEEEMRASAMIAAPPALPSAKISPPQNTNFGQVKVVDLTDREALKLASRKSRMFSALKPQNIKRRYRKKKKKQKVKPLTDRERVQQDPTQHPYYQQHKIEKKISLSDVNSHNINRNQLRQVLVDFYAFYDPVTSQSEISEVVQYALEQGVDKLNEKLIAKYNTGLILTEAIINKRTTIIVRNHREVATSAKITRNLTTPGLEDRGDSIKANTDKTKTEAAIVILEKSKSVTETRDALIDFYRRVEPDRMEKWEKGKTKDFIGEILAWTFRFGVTALADNLREKYLNTTRVSDGSVPVNNVPNNNSNNDPYAAEWSDPKHIAKCLQRFYVVYNPGRLERSLQTLIDFVLDNGVEEFNKILNERYNDNLFTFENTEHVQWRGELMQRLFDFFSKVDPQVIAFGLNNLIYWTERQNDKIHALNQYLRQKYNCDLDSVGV